MEKLSALEQRVMSDVAAGLSDRQMAAKRRVTEDTIGAHRRRIYRKLGVNNAAAAVAKWCQGKAKR